MGRLRTVVLAGVLVLVVTGCGALGRGGHKGSSSSAPKPADVIDAMRDDVVEAVKEAMPGSPLDEPHYGRENCKYSKWKDTDGSGMVVGSESAGATGPTSDKRSESELVDAVVKSLTARGWTVRQGKFAASDPRKEMAKQGIAGSAQLGASRFTLKSGQTVPIVNVVMYSDCLPDPDRSKG